MSTIALLLPVNISETVMNRILVPKDDQYGIWQSNSHVTVDVT